MALATQCPHCQTTFRVANDQLKLRGGLVRCGSCREVFNGIEHLVRPELAAPVAAPGAASSPEQEQAAIAPAATAAIATQPPVSHAAVQTPQVASEPAAPVYMEPFAPEPEPEPEPPQETSAAIAVAADHPLPTASIAAPASVPEAKTASPSSTRVEAAIDGLEEDLRIAEETSQSAPADVHHTPFGLIKPSASESGEESADTPAPNVWHRHADDEPEEQMARMTLMHVAGQDDYTLAAKEKNGGTAGNHDDDELDRIIDELQRKPWRGEKNAAASTSGAADGVESSGKKKNREKTVEAEEPLADEPDFVLSARRQQRIGGALRGAMWGIGALLLVGLVGQSTYFFRDQLAARMPQLKPALTSTCAKIGCSVGLPMKIDSISFEANELQALDPARNLFSLNLLLRNHSDTVQAWPHIELTLNDANEKPIARRVFTPHDYLNPSANLAQGFASDQEQPVKVTFELLQLKASGYRVYLFYP
ncbi:putative Zn finger-like uncharacterized protein [Collimonas sp. PA-H2]|uniref:DUF3426 domain-containing protein n=1 Tax=Collimonas sp. PA-H2 TaxID=1881062 RepID=UPI000BF2C70A|nr:DUF3426 domain-containing protein [Collimonas sp. PA-H2]PFH10657.1 putative Zn finger-like uncharacterized protein [Collimonas sp. PA-H2]